MRLENDTPVDMDGQRWVLEFSGAELVGLQALAWSAREPVVTVSQELRLLAFMAEQVEARAEQLKREAEIGQALGALGRDEGFRRLADIASRSSV